MALKTKNKDTWLKIWYCIYGTRKKGLETRDKNLRLETWNMHIIYSSEDMRLEKYNGSHGTRNIEYTIKCTSYYTSVKSLKIY